MTTDIASGKQFSITKDLDNKRLLIEREFDAPVAQVWKAWTDSNLLDQWWAPKPWRAETKAMDFREGGQWLYCMVGPDHSRTWCQVNYESIIAEKSFTAEDAFCDENGNKNTSFPSMHWENEFSATQSGTRVRVEITFTSVEDLEKIIEMGFEPGFAAALGNLDELLMK